VASNGAVYTKMRTALIPAPALSESLVTLRQTTLVKEITEGRFAIGPEGLMSYLIQPSTRKGAPSVVRVCSVIAKELVLLNRQVRYTMVSELVKLSSSDADYSLSVAGSGYLVIGDVGENTKAWTAAQWEDVQAYLLQHLRRGGGLVIGDTGAVEHSLFNLDFFDAIDGFLTVKVQ
jgi:hypothetical protein